MEGIISRHRMRLTLLSLRGGRSPSSRPTRATSGRRPPCRRGAAATAWSSIIYSRIDDLTDPIERADGVFGTDSLGAATIGLVLRASLGTTVWWVAERRAR